MINQVFIASIMCLFSQVTIPMEAKVAPGRLLKISADSPGKIIKWINVSDDADLIVSDGGRWAIFCSTVPGRYKVFCWTAAGDIPSEASICTITVIGSSPNPLPINNAMLETLQIALGKIEDNDKKNSIAALIKAYQAVVLVLDSTEIKTTADFLLVARTASRKHIPSDALLSLREIFANDLDLIVSTNPTDIFTDKVRMQVKEKFKSYVNLLGQL
jgi:hypothetical protein